MNINGNWMYIAYMDNPKFYDCGLSIWLSVDPMSDKYPSLSSYNYCANNPVILVDPDGREIWIQDINGSLYKYNNGQLFDQNGNEYQAEENSFVGKAKSSLDRLKSKPTGNKLISKLETEGKTTITSSLTSDHYSNVSVDNTTQLETREEIIEWNSNGTTLPTDNAPWGSKNSTMDLGHEISHAYDAVSNHINPGITDNLEDDEWLACYRENLMRGEFHQPLRTYYGSQQDNEGKIIFGLPPRLLETVLKSVSKEKIINFEKTNLTHEKANKKKE